MLLIGQSVLRLSGAVAIGFLIGAERERQKGEGPQRIALLKLRRFPLQFPRWR